jgi:hypothetical protein
MDVSRLSSALSAIQIQSQAMDRAAARIARSGLEASVDASVDPTVAESMSGDDLVGATVDGLVASRLFTAAVRLAQTTNENIMAALRIGGYMTEQA